MIPAAISGLTRIIGQSQGYFGLPVRDIVAECRVNGAVPAMETAWTPTPAEVEAIVAGAPVILRIMGTRHPPALLYTGNPPSEA